MEIVEQPTSLIDTHARIQAARSEAPAPFLWWSGLATIAMACGRSVCTRLLGEHGPPLYPNLYIVLVGPPNSGKTLAIRAVIEHLNSMEIARVPDSITPARLLGWAAETAQRALEEDRDTGIVLALENLESLFDKRMPRDLKSFLSTAYDCSARYTRGTQGRGEERALKLCLNILAASAPSHLGTIFAPGDWQDGIASRFLLVGAETPRALLPWLGDEPCARLTADLCGMRISLPRTAPREMGWTEEATRARSTWSREHGRTTPAHPHAAAYHRRAPTHAAKIAMALAISSARGLDASISLAEWDAALAALGSLEAGLAYALSLTGGNPYAAIAGRLVEWVGAQARDVGEHELRRWLLNFIPPQYVQHTIDGLLAARALVLVEGEAPSRTMCHPSRAVLERQRPRFRQVL